ncbi:MAG: hypothetical protein Q9209_003113 [Squamulea sp. 1 TL-2023]
MLCGTSTGAKNTASPNLQAWYDRKAEAEAKRRELEDEPEEKKGFRATVKKLLTPPPGTFGSQARTTIHEPGYEHDYEAEERAVGVRK